ncbi:MAG: hypothetical protein H0V11_07935 [Actinobacteria bacterium]|nr:hypothetical protein [Actinomycetota bacterium]
MATRKQRKRRQKGRRHEYEYVYVDDEGHEVEAAPEEVRADKRTNGKAPEPLMRGGRKIEPPSWQKVGKRALWIGPLMFLTLTLIAKELTLVQRLTQTALMLGLFLPVSYLMDRTLYRSVSRRKSPPR